MLAEKVNKIDPNKIPLHLIYEKLNGNILPYIGFRDVLEGKVVFDGIRGNAALKSFISTAIARFFYENIIDEKRYIFTFGAGLELDENTILANNIAIYDRSNIKLDHKYFTIAPKIAIEIDFKIDLCFSEWTNEWDYVLAKSKKMLEFGTEKVIWITTKSKKIFVADHTEKWFLVEFNEDIPIIDGAILNLTQLLKDEDIEF